MVPIQVTLFNGLGGSQSETVGNTRQTECDVREGKKAFRLPALYVLLQSQNPYLWSCCMMECQYACLVVRYPIRFSPKIILQISPHALSPSPFPCNVQFNRTKHDLGWEFSNCRQIRRSYLLVPSASRTNQRASSPHDCLPCPSFAID